jgi:hypothetical protein
VLERGRRLGRQLPATQDFTRLWYCELGGKHGNCFLIPGKILPAAFDIFLLKAKQQLERPSQNGKERETLTCQPFLSMNDFGRE